MVSSCRLFAFLWAAHHGDQNVRKKAAYTSMDQRQNLIRTARGEVPADVVVRNAKWLDVFTGNFRSGDVAWKDGIIVGVGDQYEAQQVIDGTGQYIVPGFIDAHVHIESSLMTPVRFQQAVLPCGTTAVVWDPHEITNVKGTAGIKWALESSEGLLLDVFVMIPSCVPSTSPKAGLETSGAALTSADLLPFRSHPRVLGLAEMMNFPGLLAGDSDIMNKLDGFSAMKLDGHCPGLKGKDLNAYGVAGIHSCHESTTAAEAEEKMSKGIHVLIREGSCAKDAEALLPLLNSYTSPVLSLCSDDRNPADISASGHINCIIDKARQAGARPEDIFRTASFATALTYGLEDRGAIAPGYQADVVFVTPRSAVAAKQSWVNGIDIKKVFKSGILVDSKQLSHVASLRQSHFDGPNLKLAASSASDFAIAAPKESTTAQARVIGVIPNQILTQDLTAGLSVAHGCVQSDLTQDVLKIAVLERHHGSGGKSCAFVKGLGLKAGAIATSINHDSHNVITVGSSDELMARAVNELRTIDGGIVVVHADGRTESLALPIGGLMTDADPSVVTAALLRLKALAADAGCILHEPFLQLSFLALPVIPTLKITDKGLVQVMESRLVSVIN